MWTLGLMSLELQQKMCPSSGVSVVDAGFWQDGLVFWLDVTWQWWGPQGEAGRLDAAGLIVSQKDKMERAERRALTHISSQAGWTVLQSTYIALYGCAVLQVGSLIDCVFVLYFKRTFQSSPVYPKSNTPSTLSSSFSLSLSENHSYSWKVPFRSSSDLWKMFKCHWQWQTGM